MARSETDGQGWFRLEVPGLPGGGPQPGTVWVHRPGSLVATRLVTRDDWAPDLPVVLVLDPPSRTEILVRGPDGHPIAGARIQPRILSRDFLSVPDPLAERIETITDDRGRAVLAAFFPEEIRTVLVAAPGLGRQYHGLRDRVGWPDFGMIDLLPVGRVEGRIASSDPEIIRNRRIRFRIWNHRSRSQSACLEDLRTDASGRFAIPEAPVGNLSIEGMPTARSPRFLRSSNGLKVEAGRTTRVELTPAARIRLRGVVRERGRGRPIAGVGIAPFGAEDDENIVITDDRGLFTIDVPRDPGLQVGPVPEGYAQPVFSPRPTPTFAGAIEALFPTIELSPAGTVVGTVVDDRGEPVPGATVHAGYPVDEGFMARGRQERRAVAGPRGAFRIDGVVTGAPVTLEAVAPDGRRTSRATESTAGAEPARLVVERSDSVSLAGRVVDASGRRLAGARVHLRTVERSTGGGIKEHALVEIRGAYTIATSESGWFRTPTILDPNGVYAAIAEAEGYEPARTTWTIGKSRTFDELVLRPRAGHEDAVKKP